MAFLTTMLRCMAMACAARWPVPGNRYPVPGAWPTGAANNTAPREQPTPAHQASTTLSPTMQPWRMANGLFGLYLWPFGLPEGTRLELRKRGGLCQVVLNAVPNH